MSYIPKKPMFPSENVNMRKFKTDDGAVLRNNIKIATELGYSKRVIEKLQELKGDENAQIRVLHDARVGLLK